MVSFTTIAIANLPSVKIGTQVWTTTNLDVSKYRNGDIIPQVNNANEWIKLYVGQGGSINLNIGGWSYCKYDSTKYSKYGKVYNSFAVTDPRGLAPLGWHIPSAAEWTTLISYLGGEAVAGGKMKEVGTLNWRSPNKDATNESGFSGLPVGGCNYYGNEFIFGEISRWYVAPESISISGIIKWNWGSVGLDWNSGGILKTNQNPNMGASIRLIKD